MDEKAKLIELLTQIFRDLDKVYREAYIAISDDEVCIDATISIGWLAGRILAGCGTNSLTNSAFGLKISVENPVDIPVQKIS